jgi:hypothetical protein
MKKILIVFMALCVSCISLAQEAASFNMDELKSKEDVIPMVHKAVTYIQTTPADTTNLMRRKAEGFLFAWMEKTDEYTFPIDISMAKIMEENKSAAFVLFAGMAELLFKDKNQSDEQVKLYGVRKLIDYSKNPDNALHAGPELKKMIKAEQKGKLKEYLAKMD